MRQFAFSKRQLLFGAFALALGMKPALGETPPEGLPRLSIPVKAHAGPVPADSIVTNTTLTNDKIWILNGFTLVKAGVTLTIQPGTYIEAPTASQGVLLVDRGGYLVAAGTKDQPITFSGEPGAERGSWGGIVMLGKGISNQGIRNQYEGLPWAKFGGTDDDDSSGVLTYVRLDGPGFPLMVDRELNGITLCAVGRKTVIHHVQVHRGDDDGIEWFGGAVNADHLVVTSETDDSYDIDQGFQGNIDYAIAIQRVEAPRPRDPGSIFPLEPVGDNVIECSSSQGGEPRRSSGHWSHLTLIDNGISGGVMDAKEDCAGTWEKAVLVASGIVPEIQSLWAFRFQGEMVANNLIAPTPLLAFKDVFLTGRWKEKVNVSLLPPDKMFLSNYIREAMDQQVVSIPFATERSYGLYKDLSPSHPAIIAAKAGAIVDGDLWYKDWTFPGSLDFPLGDGPPGEPHPTVTVVATQAPLNLNLLSYCPAKEGWAILQEPLELSGVDSSGTLIWSWHGGPGRKGTQVRPTLDGGVAVSAVSTDPRYPGVQLVRLNSAGGVVFQRIYQPLPEVQILDFVQTPDSGFLFSLSRPPENQTPGWLQKVDKLGNPEWEKKFAGYRIARANSIKPTSDGGYLLAGSAMDKGEGDYSAVVLKLDGAGQDQWMQRYATLSSPQGYDAEPTLDGGYLLVGRVYDRQAFYNRAALAKVDAFGNRLWTRFLPPAVEGFDGMWTGALATQGGTLLLGYREDLTISKVDDLGAILWELPQIGASSGNARLFRMPSGKAGFCFSRPALTGNPVSCATLQE